MIQLRRRALPAAVFCSIAVLAACRQIQPSRMPAQYASPAGPTAPLLTDMIDMADPAADLLLRRDISHEIEASAWRWSGARPEMEFVLMPSSGTNFVVEFALPDVVFLKTGPVHVTATLNGSAIGAQTFELGRNKLICRIDESRLLSPGLARVVLNLDRWWTDPASGREYGLILIKAGFVPDAAR